MAVAIACAWPSPRVSSTSRATSPHTGTCFLTTSISSSTWATTSTNPPGARTMCVSTALPSLIRSTITESATPCTRAIPISRRRTRPIPGSAPGTTTRSRTTTRTTAPSTSTPRRGSCSGARARWNVIAQQTLMAQLDRKPGPGQQFWTDGWDGYPAARRRLLDYLGQRKPANPVVFGGDVHSFWVTDLKPDFDDPRSPVVATEFVGTSITSQFRRRQEELESLLADNPHIRLGNGTRRGYLRVEPLGLELVAAAVRRAGHQARLIDLQTATHKDYFRLIDDWQPDVVAFSCNYLANVPEIVDLAKLTRARHFWSFMLVGGHSASFIARDLLEHAGGAIDCIVKGDGEASVNALLEAVEHDRRSIAKVAGVVTLDGEGPPARLVDNLDALMPARDLVGHRRRYFLGTLDPCASIEFARGCPWDCSFCSAWTFYGRSYRVVSPERAVEDLASVKEPGVFIVDDVAFVQAKHGFEIGEAIARRGIRKQYYLETRGDVLLRNKDVFRLWTRLGLQYMFLGLEAIDEEGLRKYRKRISLGKAFEALEFARSLCIMASINLIADPEWDSERFAAVPQWCLEIPEGASSSA